MIPRFSISLLLLSAVFVEAETRVRIAGMESKKEQDVLGMMGDRLTHVRSDPASASRADDAAFLLRQILIKDGYADARVDSRVVNRDEILLTVREGGRRALGDVNVSGLPAEDAARMVKLFKRPAEKDRPLASTSAPFREEDVETGLSYIRQQLQAEGYWAAEVEIARQETTADGEVNIDIRVNQGPLHRIGTPRVFSADGRGTELVAATARPFVGRTATTGHLNGLRTAMEETFISRGYPDAKIYMNRALAGGVFTPEFTIELGKRVKLRDIRIEGLQRTMPHRIRDRLGRLEGDWYDQAAMNKRMRELLATGAFSSARVETEEVGEDEIDATLHLDEARAKEITLSGGFGSYQGLIARAGYSDRNLWGNLLGFSAGIELSSRGVLGETKLTDPWFYGSDYSLSGRLYALIYSREGYSSLETGLETTLTRKFGDHYTVELLAGYSLVNLSTDGLARTDLGVTVYTNPRLRLTQTLDYRDNAILPKTGWHTSFPFEIGAAIGDIATSYFKTGLSGGWYHPLGRHAQVALGGNIGVIIPSGDSVDLPIDLRLFNGGARSVRSFPERELGPLSTGDYPTGGEAAWTTNAELIRNIAGPLKGVVFFDAGTLARSYDELGSADIELAAGLGLRLDLPVGPVRLEYGYNLTRDSGEPAGTFHFAIGSAF